MHADLSRNNLSRLDRHVFEPLLRRIQSNNGSLVIDSSKRASLAAFVSPFCRARSEKMSHGQSRDCAVTCRSAGLLRPGVARRQRLDAVRCRRKVHRRHPDRSARPARTRRMPGTPALIRPAGTDYDDADARDVHFLPPITPSSRSQ